MKVTVFLNWCPYDLLDVSSKTSLANIVLQRFSGEKGKIVDLTAFASQSGKKENYKLGCSAFVLCLRFEYTLVFE